MQDSENLHNQQEQQLLSPKQTQVTSKQELEQRQRDSDISNQKHQANSNYSSCDANLEGSYSMVHQVKAKSCISGGCQQAHQDTVENTRKSVSKLTYEQAIVQKAQIETRLIQCVNRDKSPQRGSNFAQGEPTYQEFVTEYQEQTEQTDQTTDQQYLVSSHQSPVQTCRFCYGDEEPLIQPCYCKGSMAFVHGDCLGKWLETRPTLRCDICNYNIQQRIELKSPRKIVRDLIKLMIKRLKREKFFLLKVIIYSAYVILSCKKAVVCYKLLMEQLRNNYKLASGSAKFSQTVLCLMYLILILVQLAVFTTEEIRYFYIVLSKHLRLVCYDITFQDHERPVTPQLQHESRSPSPTSVLKRIQRKIQPTNTESVNKKSRQQLLSSKRSSATEELTRKVPLLKNLTKGAEQKGTQGLLKRKQQNRSGLFDLKLCDEEATRESAQAAQHMLNQQFRADQLRYQNE